MSIEASVYVLMMDDAVESAWVAKMRGRPTNAANTPLSFGPCACQGCPLRHAITCSLEKCDAVDHINKTIPSPKHTVFHPDCVQISNSINECLRVEARLPIPKTRLQNLKFDFISSTETELRVLATCFNAHLDVAVDIRRVVTSRTDRNR